MLQSQLWLLSVVHNVESGGGGGGGICTGAASHTETSKVKAILPRSFATWPSTAVVAVVVVITIFPVGLVAVHISVGIEL